MADKILFYNAKGGQGKTTLSVHYALYSKSYFYTNEYKVGTEDLYKDILTCHGEHPEFFNTINSNSDKLMIEQKSVFDFGGSLDDKIPVIAKFCDLLVIPVFYQSQAELRPLFIMLESLSKYTNNILVVINNTENQLALSLLKGLESTVNYPIKILKRSSFMNYLANEGKTPFEIDNQIKGAPKKALITLQKQLKDLFQFIERY